VAFDQMEQQIKRARKIFEMNFNRHFSVTKQKADSLLNQPRFISGHKNNQGINDRGKDQRPHISKKNQKQNQHKPEGFQAADQCSLPFRKDARQDSSSI